MTNATSKPPIVFRVGEKYTHEEVYRGLEVGNAGGIRPCIGKHGELRRLVVMTSVPTARIASENPYHDRVEGSVLVYTAAGREGNQFISGMNKRLVEQLDASFPIYGFQNIGSRRDKKLGIRRWEFLGRCNISAITKKPRLTAEARLVTQWFSSCKSIANRIRLRPN